MRLCHDRQTSKGRESPSWIATREKRLRVLIEVSGDSTAAEPLTVGAEWFFAEALQYASGEEPSRLLERASDSSAWIEGRVAWKITLLAGCIGEARKPGLSETNAAKSGPPDRPLTRGPKA
jgi:hypothetical protein